MKTPHTKIKDFIRGKKILIILIAVILIVAGAVGYCLYKTLQKEEVGKKPETEKILEPEPEKISGLKPLDDTRDTYINYELGFSIKVPKGIMHSYGSCKWDGNSYRPKEAPVPVKVFEGKDNKVVYIASEYFYELGGETRKDYVSYFSECNKTLNSIELLELPKDGCEQSQYQHCWKIVTRDITNDDELEEFIKERYGSGCGLGEKVETRQEGVFDVKIKGDGKDLEFTKCPMTYGVVLKYYPEKNKVISWRFGIQAPTFYKDYNLGGEYDSEMIKSFNFLGIEDETVDLSSKDLSTEGWEVYQNKEYGYEIKYPQDWKTKERNLMSDLGHRDFVWIQSNGDEFSVDVWNFSVYSYDQLTEPPPGGIDPDTIKKTEIIIDGQPATGLSYTAVGDGGSGVWKIKEVFVQKNQLLYKIKSCDSKECDQILSTFRFIEIDETAGWETYTDTTAVGFGIRGFELKYPPSWQVSTQKIGQLSTIYLKDTKSGNTEYNYVVLSIDFAPNDGGLTADEWWTEASKNPMGVNYFYRKIGTTSIGGLNAIKFKATEAVAGFPGPRYILTTQEKGGWIFDIDSRSIEENTINEILSTFKFIE